MADAFRSVVMSQDYLKSVVPSQLMSERGSNLVVINPGMQNPSLHETHVPYYHLVVIT